MTNEELGRRIEKLDDSVVTLLVAIETIKGEINGMKKLNKLNFRWAMFYVLGGGSITAGAIEALRFWV
jgi:hypothetical protein